MGAREGLLHLVHHAHSDRSGGLPERRRERRAGLGRFGRHLDGSGAGPLHLQVPYYPSGRLSDRSDAHPRNLLGPQSSGRAFHGGSRRDVKLCAMCHNPQTVDPDTGENQDMDVIIHKIHRGANLPSVQAGKPYIIVGYNQSIHDYSHVVYPQDIRNCKNCHVGTVPNQAPSQASAFMTEPTRAACGSCHDNINWVTGEGHAAGPATSDDRCGTCHQPDGPEFGPSVKGAHVVPAHSSQLLGLNATIVSVSNVKPGENPTIVIKVTNNDGTAVDPTTFATFAPMMAGPTTSYLNYWREDARKTLKYDAATGNTTYTFTKAIPADATGTYAFTVDVRRSVNLKRADGEADVVAREAAFNPIHYAAVTGTVATPRRTAVDVAKCNSCHDLLTFHGGQRLATQQCAICHHPKLTAAGATKEGPKESVSFQYMIHKIHRGEELQNGYFVKGSSYGGVVYPGALTDCNGCHVNGSQQLPPPVTADAVDVPAAFFTPLGPGTAACLSCHDSRDAAAHAYLNTANFPGSTTPAEACATCHGPNSEWSVDKIHAD
ncbi:MAG: OmcA/MtrC family decaheme c-type cytochrome [Acidobacteria bacterium]|nr:OmcA/MtrC family decaheme c-type cytochrome [Acidobacteriota bacterium]